MKGFADGIVAPFAQKGEGFGQIGLEGNGQANLGMMPPDVIHQIEILEPADSQHHPFAIASGQKPDHLLPGIDKIDLAILVKLA